MHVPILTEEILEHLCLKPGNVVCDATLGGGGHAKEILRKITPQGRLIGIDQDREAIDRTKLNLKEFDGHYDLIEANFRQIDHVLKELKIDSIDAILFDLGISSDQILSETRGFSFQWDSPLDMRMDLKSPLTAADLINDTPEEDLANIFWQYGEERGSRRIAKVIVEERHKKRISTCLELSQLIEKKFGRRGRIHPATKVFQALRIVVNDELGAVEEALPKAIQLLKPHGRIAVLTFHSLEDRIVKRMFKEKHRVGEIKIINKKVIKPSREEVLSNSKSRSAKLRVAEKPVLSE